MATDRSQRRIELLLDEADDAVTRLDWETVKAREIAVLALDPDNTDARTLLAAVERAIGEASGATQAFSDTSSPATAGDVAEQPTSFSSGRYQVKRFLGEGGKKKVYLATDTLLDRDVAFALIKTEGLDQVSRTRITREAQAMGRLGSHPHIVTVFDLGDHEGQPFMVTELMGGGDVEGVVEKAPEHRLSLDQAVNIAREACRGLEFAHSRGIVHRDLKPGNIWLTNDGVAKIGDFGLAVAIDRSRLTTEGMMVGTVSYMPPEQAMGGAVTPRSDLYSLGAMLYEMVTGRPPFLGDDSVAIIGQHINTPPVAPTWHNPECPRALEALIMRLLAKDPAERPESASDVLAALEGVDLNVSVDTLQPDPVHSLDSLAGGVFVGRQREMGELKACLEDALSGRGRLVTLMGEPGIGKTRTAQELATYAGLRGAQVLWGRCYEEPGMPPYWPWVQAVRSYVRETDPDQLRLEMGVGASEIGEVVSILKEKLPDLPAPPQLDSPEQARFKLFDAITAFLKTASQRQPLALVLDDLHWADQPSLLLLQFVARELGNARVLLVGTYRDIELSRQHPLAESLAELTRERLFQRVLLRGLSLQDVGRFIEVVTGTVPPGGLTQAVYTHTEGNPLFITEVVRLLVQEGDLTQERTGDRDSWSVRIPEGVREVIGRRLNRLSQRCNETLSIASVIGREFTLAQMIPLLEDLTEDRLLETLEEALTADVVEELPQALGRYQFTHALIQETLNQELTLTRRVRLHARIAEALEALYGANSEDHAAELAHHFGEAEAVLGTEKLVHYSLLAGNRALASYAWEEALSHFQRGLEAKGNEPADAETASLLFGLGRSQAATLGRHQFGAAVDSLTRAFDYYAEIRDIDRAVEVALYRVSQTNAALLAGATRLIPRALQLVPPDSLQAGYLLSRYAVDLGRLRGNYQGAQEAFAGALGIATRENDVLLKVQTLANAADLDSWFCNFNDALAKCLQSIELVKKVDDPNTERLALMEAAWCCIALGRPVEANQHALACLEMAKRERNRDALAASLAQACTIATLVGDLKSARGFLDEVSASDIWTGRMLNTALVLEFESGNFKEGGDYLQRLLNLAGDYPTGPSATAAMPAFVIPYAARVTGVSDGLERARSVANSTLSFPNATPSVISLARYGLGLIAVLQGDAESAKEQYGVVQQWRGTTPNGTVAADYLLGLLAYTMLDLNASCGHFEDSSNFCRKADYRPALAWTCCDYADTLLQRNSSGDREKAMSLLDESLAISTELGMRPLIRRILSRREILRA